VVSGAFTRIGELDASRIARWNGTAWRALGAGLPGVATAIAHDATTVYASTFDEGAGAYLLGAFDVTDQPPAGLVGGSPIAARTARNPGVHAPPRSRTIKRCSAGGDGSPARGVSTSTMTSTGLSSRGTTSQ